MLPRSVASPSSLSLFTRPVTSASFAAALTVTTLALKAVTLATAINFNDVRPGPLYHVRPVAAAAKCLPIRRLLRETQSAAAARTTLTAETTLTASATTAPAFATNAPFAPTIAATIPTIAATIPTLAATATADV